MAFGLRINFVDVICDNSLRSVWAKGHKVGYSFDIRLSYYRGLFLSCVDQFELKVDGQLVDSRNITFNINGKSIPVDFLSNCASEFWGLTVPATIEVTTLEELKSGAHEMDLTLMLRVPYMPIPTADKLSYMPLNSCGTKTLTLEA